MTSKGVCAYYRMEADVGGTTETNIGSIGGSGNFTYQNTPTMVQPGVAGRSVLFSASSSEYLAGPSGFKGSGCTTGTDLSGLNMCTSQIALRDGSWVGWFKLNSTTGPMTIIGDVDTSAGSSVFGSTLYFWLGDLIYEIWRSDLGGNTFTKVSGKPSPAGSFSTGVWYFFAVTLDGNQVDSTGYTLKLYIGTKGANNLSLRATNTTPTGSMNCSGPGNYHIGAMNWVSGGSPIVEWFFDGWLDEIGMFSKTLTSTEVQDIYDQCQAGGDMWPWTADWHPPPPTVDVLPVNARVLQ